MDEAKSIFHSIHNRTKEESFVILENLKKATIRCAEVAPDQLNIPATFVYDLMTILCTYQTRRFESETGIFRADIADKRAHEFPYLGHPDWKVP